MKTIYIFLILFIVPFSFKAQKDTRKAFANQLVLQLQNEKLARDFYTGMFNQWKLIAFKNLSKCVVIHL